MGGDRLNLVDLAVMAVMAVSVVFGLFQGFLVAGLHLVSFGASVWCATAFYEKLAAWVSKNTGLAEMILGYTQGSAHIPDAALANAPVAGLSSQQQSAAADIAGTLPAPFDTLIPLNIKEQVFDALGTASLAEYFDATLSAFILNAVCFIAIFFACAVAFWLIIALVDAIRKLPVLKFFDTLLGGALGLARGLIIVMVVFLVVPIVLTVLPVDAVKEAIDTSVSAPYFYEHNPLYGILR